MDTNLVLYYSFKICRRLKSVLTPEWHPVFIVPEKRRVTRNVMCMNNLQANTYVVRTQQINAYIIKKKKTLVQ